MVASHFGKEYPLSCLRSFSHLTREEVSVSGIRNALNRALCPLSGIHLIIKCLFNRESLWPGVGQQSTIWCTSEGAGQSRAHFPRCGSRGLRLLRLVVEVYSLSTIAIDDTQDDGLRSCCSTHLASQKKIPPLTVRGGILVSRRSGKSSSNEGRIGLLSHHLLGNLCP